MRKKLGVLFMLLGLVLVLGSLLLIVKNQQEDQLAQKFSSDVLPLLRNQITKAQEIAPTETTPELPPNIPVEYLAPEDLTMTEEVINGYAYIGYLTVPDLGLELPVMSDWSYRQMQYSPCRYAGTVRGEDLVIMAHNYSGHFGRLSRLSIGAQVQFVDMDGTVWDYEVVAIDVLPAEAVEEMTAGEYDLSLFTCSTNRTYRVTVRCDMI